MIKFKYRTWHKGIEPRRIKLEIPGWAGQKTNESGQPHHCKPFVDGATYGYEIIYPYSTEIRVRCDNDEGICQFLVESQEEFLNIPGGMPVANFAPNHFGFTSSLDIQTEEGWGTMIIPHPRFFTDRTGTVPLPVHGLIESDIWPKIFFIPFRAPLKGYDYVFRKGQGIAHLIFVPKTVEYECTKMTPEEEKIRVQCDKVINDHGRYIATKKWKDSKNQAFDNKYKVLSQIAKKDGNQAVIDHLLKIDEDVEKHKAQQKEKFKFKIIKPEKENGL